MKNQFGEHEMWCVAENNNNSLCHIWEKGIHLLLLTKC